MVLLLRLCKLLINTIYLYLKLNKLISIYISIVDKLFPMMLLFIIIGRQYIEYIYIPFVTETRMISRVLMCG